MTASIRPATAADIPQIVPLLVQDAQRRSALDPKLWRTDAQMADRITAALTTAFNPETKPAELILVAEAGGKIVGLSHGMLVPVPPIYDPGVTPGLLLDDACVSPSAPSGTAEALLAAIEAALRITGASSFIASCEANSPMHAIYTASDYEPVTHYLAKHGFADAPYPADIRLATAADVPAIVTLSTAHRKTLQKINDRFWHIHPDADTRFGMWMGYSLTLKDRDMLAATAPDGLAGYAIAQPCPRMHIPPAHDIAGLGIIDDFYNTDFAAIENLAHATSGSHLLGAAESAFARRGVQGTLVVCPAAWTSKQALLKQHGYKLAKLWMLKKAS